MWSRASLLGLGVVVAPLHRWHAGEVTYEDFEPFKGAIRLSRFRLVRDKLGRSTGQRQS